MTALTPTTEIVRVPSLWMDLDTSNELRVHTPTGSYRLGTYALAILDAVHLPTTVGDALRRVGRNALPSAAPEIARTLVQLMSSGVVRPRSEIGGFAQTPFPKGGYDSAYVHLRMLDDRARKLAFTAAVRATVRAGDVVVDLGTGSGILAMAAARAGAAHVYAIEPSNMRTLAAQVFKDNGFEDVIEVVPGWSGDFALEHRADVLTTDIVGNEPLDMRLWETVHDARQRLLTPDARTVPSAVEAFAVLASVPDDDRRAHLVLPEHVQAWNEEYGIDFSALLSSADRPRLRGFYERPEVVSQWELGEHESAVYRVSLADPPGAFRRDVSMVCDLPSANAVVLYFRAELGPDHVFVADPRTGGETSHWYCAVWLRQEPWQQGEVVCLRYSYVGDGHSLLEEVGP